MYRILIADDEPMALYSTAHAFPWADWGFDPPVLMTEAPAALDKLRAERFDAAIVDIRMPQMTGIDLIRLSGEAGLQTVFIVLSGYSDFSYVQTALRLSAFDYCLKPILPDAAQAALERLSQAGFLGRCRLLPYQAVGVECGMLLALRLDGARVGTEDYGKLLLALSPTRLTDGGGYHALIGT